MPAKFPCDPSHDFESLDLFLERLTRSNTYQNRSWLLEYMGLSYREDPNLISSETALSILADFSLVDKNRLLKMTLHRFVPYLLMEDEIEQLDVEHWRQRDFPVWNSPLIYNFYNRKVTKVCPECYEQTRSNLLLWNLVPVTSCPVHNVLLIDKCSNCGARLDLAEGVCSKCGLSLLKNPVKSIANDDFSMELSTAVQTMLNSEDLNKVPIIGPILSSPMYFYFLYQFGKIVLVSDRENPLWKNTSFEPPCSIKYYKIRSLDVQSAHQLFLAANNALLNWPHSFYSTLDRISWLENKVSISSQRAPYSFPTKLRRVFSNPIWNWLWIGWKDFVISIGDKSNIPSYWFDYYDTLPSEITGEIPAVIRPTHAARILGVWITTLNRKIKTGDLMTYGNLTPKGRNFFLIDAQVILETVEKNKKLLTRQQSADYLGINRNLLYLFIEEGLLITEATIFPGNAKWRFTKEQLDDLIRKVKKHTVPKSVPTEYKFFTHYQAIICIRYPAFTICHLIQAVLNDQINAYWDETRNGFRALWFEQADVFALKKSLFSSRTDGIETYSIYETMKILGIGLKKVKLFCETNLLSQLNPSEEDLQKWVFVKSDIDLFKEKHINIDETATIIGRSTRTIATWVENGILEAVSGVRVNGMGPYLFDKEYIINWRKNRLQYTEVMELLGINRHVYEYMVAKGKLIPIKEMGTHILWFDREQVESIKKRRK